MKMLKLFLDALGMKETKSPGVILGERLRDGVMLHNRSLITGGTANDRSNLIALAAAQAKTAGTQVLVLHRRTSQVRRALDHLHPVTPGYDPLAGKTPAEAALLLSNCAMAEGYDGAAIYLLLEDILQLILSSGEPFSIYTLLKSNARGWHQKLMEDHAHFLDTHVNEKVITELSRFMAQLRTAFPTETASAVSFSADLPFLCLDMGENQLVWHLALLELSQLHERQAAVCVILEAPPIDPVLLTLTRDNWEDGALIISGPDLTARRETWPELSADLVLLAAFQHESGHSCDCLAQYFGQCERTKIEHNKGISRENTALFTQTVVTGTASRTVREYLVIPERIQQLAPSQAVLQIRGCGQAVCTMKAPPKEECV